MNDILRAVRKKGGRSPTRRQASRMESDAYQRLRRRTIYANPWLSVDVHDIRHPTGTPGEHVCIVPPPTSAVLVENDGIVTLVRQPRFAAGAEVVEIVKGGGEPGESPLDTARREAREELGIAGGDWTSLGWVYEVPSILQGRVELFVVRGAAFGPAGPEPVERIAPVRLPVRDALTAAADGEIADAVTVAALFRYAVAGRIPGWAG